MRNRVVPEYVRRDLLRESTFAASAGAVAIVVVAVTGNGIAWMMFGVAVGFLVRQWCWEWPIHVQSESNLRELEMYFKQNSHLQEKLKGVHSAGPSVRANGWESGR